MKTWKGRRLTRLTSQTIAVSIELSELERTAKYGSDPAARRKAAVAIIKQRDALKRSLEGCGPKPTPTTNDEFDMFKYAVERLALSEDKGVRGMAFEATDRNVLSMRMISRTNPHSDVGKMAKRKLHDIERPNTHDENGLVLFVPPKWARHR